MKIKNVTIKGIDDVKAEVLYPSLFYKKIKKYDKIIMSEEDVGNIHNQMLTHKQKEPEG